MSLPDETSASQDSSSAPASELPLPEKSKRPFFARVFSAEHKFGRFIRALGTALAVVVILLGLGALAVWYFQLRPLRQQYQELQVSATQTAAELQTSRDKLAEANQGLSSARVEAVDVQSSLSVEQGRVHVLSILLQLSEARLAVMDEDIPGAKKSLDLAEENLTSLLAQIEKTDQEQAKTLQTLFSLAKNDLERDKNLFAQDVIRLSSELELVEKSLNQ